MSDEHDERDELETTGQVPAAPGSPLSGLRARREQAKSKLYKDFEVPRLDPPVYVRFKPLSQAVIEAGQKRVSKTKDPDILVQVNAGFLATACVGVFEVVDGREVSVDPDDRDGDWPKFDEKLAELLGLNTTRAADVVRGLYLTDGDVITTAGQLAQWSGYTGEELDREFEGN